MTASVASPKPRLAHCQLDDWDFDPRFTGGVCPICGWHPEGAAASPRPAYLAWTEGVQWDLVGLVLLFVVLVIMGVLVGRAAGINLAPR